MTFAQYCYEKEKAVIQVSETEIRERISQLRAMPTDSYAQAHFIGGLIIGLEWAIGLNSYTIGTIKEVMKQESR